MCVRVRGFTVGIVTLGFGVPSVAPAAPLPGVTDGPFASIAVPMMAMVEGGRETMESGMSCRTPVALQRSGKEGDSGGGEGSKVRRAPAEITDVS